MGRGSQPKFSDTAGSGGDWLRRRRRSRGVACSLTQAVLGLASLDFFAVREDILDILGFLYSETDFRVFELASRFGQELREFRSAEEVERVFPIGLDVHGHGFGSTFHLWSPTVMHRLDIQRVALDPRRCEGHTHRYELVGGALVQLYLGGVHGRVITKSHYGHNSRERAEKWGVSGEADW